MTKPDVFSYEFDGPRTVFTRYGKPIERAEVVAILNYAIEMLRELEVMAAQGMTAGNGAGWGRAYSKIGAVLNYAEIDDALITQEQTDDAA